VEELLLRRILARDELHVVHHQHVDGAEHVLEVHHLLFAQRLHEAIHELFGGEIDHPQRRVARLDLVRDGVHQVGLAEADAAIEEQRVEGDRATFGDPTGGGMGELVGLADHEAVEGEARIERRAGQIVFLCADGRGAFGRVPGLRRFRPRHAGHGEHEARNAGACIEHMAQDPVAEIALHPVADEAGGNEERGHAVFKLGEFQRLDPVAIIVLSYLLAKNVPNLAPNLVRHYQIVPLLRRRHRRPVPTSASPARHDRVAIAASPIDATAIVQRLAGSEKA